MDININVKITKTKKEFKVSVISRAVNKKEILDSNQQTVSDIDICSLIENFLKEKLN